MTVPGDIRATDDERRRFLIVAGSATALVTALIVALSVHAADGHLVYVIDDPAIHMSMARQLAQHGTWGVTAGVYEPASSAPLWTALLGLIAWIIPSSLNLLPLLLNVVAVGAVLWIFASYQTFVTPRRADPMSWIATITMPVVLLFLPGLIMLGMEHVAHSVLCLIAMVLLVRLEDSDLRLRELAPLLAVVFVAGTIRVETVFLALGVAIGFQMRRTTRFGDAQIRWTRGAALRAGALVVGTAAAPFIMYGIVNRAFHRSFLPNSIIAKAAQSGRGPLQSPGKVLEALASDPILIILGLGAAAYLCWVGVSGHRDHVLPVTTFLVALLAQGMWGDIGWWGRYQAWLIMLGVLVLCRAASEIAVGVLLRPALLVFLLAYGTVSTGRTGLTISTPLASSNTYRQRYQLGKFFAAEYQGQAIATGELGYSTLFHDGPAVDLLGLGTYDVAIAMRDHNGTVPASTVAQLLHDHHVRVVGVYPATLGVAKPPKAFWQAGRWRLTEENVSTFQDAVDFFAPSAQYHRELEERLARFSHQLPSHVKYLNRAAMLEDFFKHPPQ